MRQTLQCHTNFVRPTGSRKAVRRNTEQDLPRLRDVYAKCIMMIRYFSLPKWLQAARYKMHILIAAHMVADPSRLLCFIKSRDSKLCSAQSRSHLANKLNNFDPESLLMVSPGIPLIPNIIAFASSCEHFIPWARRNHPRTSPGLAPGRPHRLQQNNRPRPTS